MKRLKYLVYVNGGYYDEFLDLEQAESFVDNFKKRYPNVSCYIKEVWVLIE